MTIRAAAASRRSRWALSFADLSLLLLGFFVLLHASNGRQQEIVGGVAEQFGAPSRPLEQLAANALFQPGEALLGPAGDARLGQVAKKLGGQAGRIEIRSVGVDPATNRFDSWDLAAARLGAVARGLVDHGIAADRVVVRGLDQQSESKSGQQILIRLK